MVKLTILPIILLSISCKNPREAPSPAPIKPPDTNMCGEMCNRIGVNGLKCEEGNDVYDSDKPGVKGVPNTSCKDFCIEMQTKGLFINPKCVAKVPDCKSIELYRKKKPEICI